MLDEKQGQILVALARNAIAAQLGLPQTRVDASGDWLKEPSATFVTLTRHGQLRGCIGTLEAHRTLLEDVRANAVAAAFRDLRFSPLTEDEFAETHVEVSLLSAAQPLTFSDEADALRQLRPGVDGIILEHGRQRSTFLPQVWEQLPLPHQFMAHLKMKAGLPADFWSEDIRLARYTVTKWKEEKASAAQATQLTN